MAPSRFRHVVMFSLAALAMPVVAQPQASIDKAFDAYWHADNPKEAAKAATKVLASGADFDAIWRRLRQGRIYKKEKTGEFLIRYPAGAIGIFDNRVEVPADYDPSQTMPLRVQLHGGVNRRRQGGRGGADIEGDPSADGREGGAIGGQAANLTSPDRRAGPNRIAGEPQIYVYPTGWVDAPWWSAVQIDNIMRVVDTLSRRYNIDESQVYLTGISDGGTGAYYIGMREATRWSAVMPLNGSIIVLGNPAIGAEGELFPNNLVNTPMYIVNGGRDPLYPVANVMTHLPWFKGLGIDVTFRPQMEAGHDTSWWPTERAPYEAFVHAHRREPYPNRLSWETERVDRFNRARWLVMDALGPASSDTAMPSAGYFKHSLPSGRVDVERNGNAFEAHTRGVKAFRLLLSPDVVDFAKPVTVMVNGKAVFEGLVTKDPAVLLAWHARDNDRTMLYGAEMKVVVP